MPPLLQDLPVCFPDEPCASFVPLEAQLIDLTSSLTGASGAIAAGCFAAFGVGLALVAFGLTRRYRLTLSPVAVSTALAVTGAAVAGVVDLRLGAIRSIYGPGGPADPGVLGSWALVGLAGRAMAIAGVGGLVVTAVVAVVWLKTLLDPDHASAD